jgi:hypothetical protein
MMFRLFAFATLFLVAVCLVIGVSIALADDNATPAAAPPQSQTIEAVDPDHRMIDDSLAAEDGHDPSAILEIWSAA